MLNALCTASMNVSDIVILAVLAVGIVAGIIAGFAKLLNGTIGGIIAFIAAICLGIFLAGYLAGVSAFVDLQTKISDFFVSKFDVAGYKAKVSDGELFLNVSGQAYRRCSKARQNSKSHFLYKPFASNFSAARSRAALPLRRLRQTLS